MPEKKFASVSFAAKPMASPAIPADASQAVRFTFQINKIKYVPPPIIISFRVLSKSGMVFF